MDSCDVLIVGGGPAGSSCAWKLRDRGLDVAILDKQSFPRDKICGGWITPEVLDVLAIDPDKYGRGRVLQPITAFRTGCIEGSALDTSFGKPVSYGIRRCEFDDYLLKRSGARILPPSSLTSLERSGDGWIADENIRAHVVVGAGGHFCPVARLTGARLPQEDAVVAQEAEFEMDAQQLAQCRVSGNAPELYFSSDMKGYGWCFRKRNFLNVGLGRMDPHRLPDHVAAFLRFLKSAGRLLFDVPAAFHGHAYLLQGVSTRNVVADGLLLIGDAAGLAYEQSGEGIRPAIESGLMAAESIAAAQGQYSRERLEPYRVELGRRFRLSAKPWIPSLGRRLPPPLKSMLALRLLGTRWFTRDVVLKRWFLHWNELRPARATAPESPEHRQCAC
jgi:flavin-dependent dehydrogenase